MLAFIFLKFFVSFHTKESTYRNTFTIGVRKKFSRNLIVLLSTMEKLSSRKYFSPKILLFNMASTSRLTSWSLQDLGKQMPTCNIVWKKMIELELFHMSFLVQCPYIKVFGWPIAYLFKCADVNLPSRVMFRPYQFVFDRKRWFDFGQILIMILM